MDFMHDELLIGGLRNKIDTHQCKALSKTTMAIATAPTPIDRHCVRHNYHDHSKDKASDYSMLQSEEDGAGVSLDHKVNEGDTHAKKRKGPRGGVTVPFPTKLHVMLTKVEEDGFGHIVSWQPHGRAFSVHDPKAFVHTVMPKYFRQSKLTSFQRQLNLYGFSRLTSGKDRGGYYHEMFLRHKLFLCQSMTRIRIKGTGIKGKASPETEPDFYSMPMVVPDADTTNKANIEEIVATAIEENKNTPFNRSYKPKRMKEDASASEAAFDSNNATSPKVEQKAFVPPVVEAAIESMKCTSPKVGKEAFVPPAFVTPDTQRSITSISFPASFPLAFSSAAAAAPSQKRASFCLQSRSFRNVGHENTERKPPFISSDSGNSSSWHIPPHDGDTMVFEGKQFQYLDSLASHEYEDMAFHQRQAPGHMQRAPSLTPIQTHDIGSTSFTLAQASRTASSLSLPHLISSLQSSETDSFGIQSPILSPSSSSSSICGMASYYEEHLEFGNPDTIFSCESPVVDWDISEGVDIDAEFSLMNQK